jgi:hypothetical protein
MASHVRPDQLPSLAAQARNVSGSPTALDDLIRIVNVTGVWRRWRKPVLVVVARDVPEHYAYLREAFGGVPWAQVVVDRRRQPRGVDARPWTIAHGDPVDVEAVRVGRPRLETLGVVRLLRWTWNTGWRLGEHAACQAFPLVRG